MSEHSTDTDDKQSGVHLSLNYLPLRHILSMSKSDSHLGTGNAPFESQTYCSSLLNEIERAIYEMKKVENSL